MKFSFCYFHHLLCFLLFLSHQATLSSSSSSPPEKHLCSSDQSIGLIKFKSLFSINQTASKDCEFIPYNPKTNSWKEGKDCCLWDGVSCDNTTGQVISLDLSCSGLSGTFPLNSSLFLLSHLQMLDLSFNDFKNSKIPSEFGLFRSLTHLHLSRSSFFGRVPYEISYLTKLVSLDLSSASTTDLIIQEVEPVLKLEQSTLNGIVRNLTKVRHILLDVVDMSSVDSNSLMNLSSSLTSLSLLGCDLRGTFPETILKLPKIRSLSLDTNPSLFGQLPKSNWSSPLEDLDVSDTSFFGELPESIGDLKSLHGFGLIGCNFSGSIPRSLGNLSNLLFVFLSYNNFSGRIPSSLTNLTQLILLDISSNRLEGSIPNNPKAFQNLGFLDLSDNLFSSTTPSWLYNHPSLTFLNLATNNFSGPINKFQQSFLEYVNVQDNNFQGTIPSSVSKLVNLTFLDFSSNSLEGTVTFDIFSKLRKLTWLGLSSNSLSLRSSNSNVDFVLPNLEYANLKSCKISQFPKFLEGSKVLKILDLSNNRISGQISAICNLKFLEILDLSHNNFSGIIPHCIGNFSKSLSSLKLNKLHGIIPPTFARGCRLKNLNFNSNHLEGPLTRSISNCKDLEVLDLGNNKINDTFPHWIVELKSLSSLNLKMNKLHGTIPPTFARGCGLKNLNLNSNHLEGPLTRSISNCKDLEVLDLGNNQINDTFPNWMVALSDLQVLILHGNEFHGSIGTSKNPQSLPKLRIIDLSRNNFFGPLPSRYIKSFKGMIKLDEGKTVHYMGERNYSYDYSVDVVIKGFEIELVKILTIFTTIDLSGNNFEGEIPCVIGELSSLRGLNLSHNNLVGHIPPSLGNLTQLEWLDLSSNKLDGKIPRELVDLTFLSLFNVSNNQLVGPIPQGKQFNTFEDGSYEGNKGLCGLPLSKARSNNEPGQPTSLTNSHKDDASVLEFGWEVVLIGYGFGFIFGVGMGYVALRVRKLKWLVTWVECGGRSSHKLVGRRNF